jgi:hypothetical protein
MNDVFEMNQPLNMVTQIQASMALQPYEKPVKNQLAHMQALYLVTTSLPDTGPELYTMICIALEPRD